MLVFGVFVQGGLFCRRLEGLEARLAFERLRRGVLGSFHEFKILRQCIGTWNIPPLIGSLVLSCRRPCGHVAAVLLRRCPWFAEWTCGV